MPLTELTEILARFERANLQEPAEAGALVRRVAQLESLLGRLGAVSSAAQLGLAATLLERARRQAEQGDEVRQTVGTLLRTVERAFHVEPPPSGETTTDASAREPRAESRRPAPATQLRIRVARDLLLGEMLVHFGVVSQEQLETALQLQRGTQKRLGEILIERGFTSEADIRLALGHQQKVRGVEAAARPAAVARPVAVAKKGPAPPLPRVEAPSPLRMGTELLLGEILVLQGALTRKALEQGLQLQRKSGRRLGETLLRAGCVTRQQLQNALAMQSSRRRERSRATQR